MTDDAAYTLFETTFGPCGIAWTDRGVVRTMLPEANVADTETRLRRQAATSTRAKPPAGVDLVIRLIQAYFEGAEVDFANLSVDLSPAQDFDRRVYEALRTVRWGETTTYGDLAHRAGTPGGARAVGRAMAKNPLPVIVPCHRVLAARGQVGGFSAHGGVTTKQRMLALEKVMLAV